MATAKVVSIQPQMDQNGNQRSWTNPEGKTFFYFMYLMDNGMRGEVGHMSQAPRFQVGDELEVTDTTKDAKYPKLKLDKAGQGKFGGGKSGSSAWSPEKNFSVMAQGFIKAAVQAGAKEPEQIEHLANNQIRAHANMMAKWKQRNPEQPAQQAPQQVQQPMQHPTQTYPQSSGASTPVGQQMGAPQPGQIRYQPQGAPGGQPVYQGTTPGIGGASAFPDDELPY